MQLVCTTENYMSVFMVLETVATGLKIIFKHLNIQYKSADG